ncbi:DedA family protein [Blastococcus sp. Marseille-P5729]|uniref:DedA family protein n=1 Tax=Blastococcus sp. Marseille-P5729 TaxID=2086582 RepID=UPI0018FE9D84|nr:DedA family protein [Blastococcus sp. Marseille-P5729]
MSVTVLAQSSSELGGIAGWAVDLMEKLGGLGAGLAIALENLFPPLPSEVILPLAGFTASQGKMSLVGALLWTTAGSVVGAAILYWLGVLLGRDRLRAIVDKMPLVSLADVDKTEAWFDRHGKKAVFFGRMIPIFRSLISIPAGIQKMSFGVFVLLTTAGSAIWNTIFVLAGYFLGSNWDKVEVYAGYFQYVVIAVVAVLLIWWLVRRIQDIRRRRAAGLPDSDDPSDLARAKRHPHA